MVFSTLLHLKKNQNSGKMKTKAIFLLAICVIMPGLIRAQSVDILYKEKWNNRYGATIYFSGSAGEEEIPPEDFLGYEYIYFAIKPNPQSEKEFFKEKDLDDCFVNIRLLQDNQEIRPAQPPRNLPNTQGDIEKVLLTFPKRDVQLYEPFVFRNELDTTEAITLSDNYFMYYNKYRPIYEQGMGYSDQMKYPETFATLMEIVEDARVQQEIKYYSFYRSATETLIENAIRQHADSLGTLLTNTEITFMQSFSEPDLIAIDSIYAMVLNGAGIFKPYFEMDFPKSRELEGLFTELTERANTIRARNLERFKNNKLLFLENETYDRYQFSFYIDLLARMVTNLDTLIVIQSLDTLNMATLSGMPDYRKELKITGWEEDFTTIVSLLNKEITETGTIFNDSIMSNLQKQKSAERQPYQQIFLAFNALSTNEMLFDSFLRSTLPSCTNEDLLNNLEMWLLSYNLTFASIPETTVSRINSGIKLIEQQRWDEALTVFNTITRQANTIAPPWFYLGLILYEKEQTFAADAKFDLALEIYPQYIAPRLFKFRILYDQQDYEKLLTKTDEAIQQNDIWMFHFWKAKALFALEEFNAAIREIEENCLEMNSWNSDEYFLLGDAYTAISKFNLAEKAYSKTQEINPHSMDTRYNEKMQLLQEARKGE